MLDLEASYLFYTIIVSSLFFFFCICISIFGRIFFELFEKKINKSKWNLNFLEKFFVSFGFGLSIYISICFLLDFFMIFNFFSAYLSVIIVDIIYTTIIVFRNKPTRTRIINLITLIKSKILNNYKALIIISAIIIVQFLLQYPLLTERISLLGTDSFYWLNRTIFLLDNQYIARNTIQIYYPDGFVYFSAACLLPFSNFELDYFFFKFAAIPLLSLYLINISIIIKRFFKNNYYLIFGLLMVLTSNYLISRLNNFITSSIPTFLILISFIIIYSNCPIYLLGFFFPILYFFNPFYGLIYGMAIILYVLIKFFYKEKTFRFFIFDLIKIVMLSSILLIPYVIYLFLLANFNISSLFFFWYKTMVTNRVSSGNIYIHNNYITLNLTSLVLLENTNISSTVLKDFLSLENYLISFFIIFSFIFLLIPTKGNSKKIERNLIIITKICVILLLLIYFLPSVLSNFSPILSGSTYLTFKMRFLEAFCAPIIIAACFTFRTILDKAELLTKYLIVKFVRYGRLCMNGKWSKIFKIKNILIIILILSSVGTYINHTNVYRDYYFTENEIEVYFFIKQNIPHSSEILFQDYSESDKNYLSHILGYDYELKMWNYASENETETRNYVKEEKIKYILLDLDMINSTESNNYIKDSRFDMVFENDRYLIFDFSI